MSTTSTTPIQRTQEFFGARFNAELTAEDARDTNERIRQIFQLLDKWNRLYPVPTNAALLPDTEKQGNAA